MGYYVTLEDHDVEIIKLFHPLALAAIKEMAEASAHLSWVDHQSLLACETLEQALEEFRYDTVIDEKGSLRIREFTGQKWGSDQELWIALAPYLRDLSYLEWRGEDGEAWRYEVSVGRLYERTEQRDWSEPSLIGGRT